MYLILQSGFEGPVRTKLGVRSGELPDGEIKNKFIASLAESHIIKRVPAYSEIKDARELLFLESAVISYICYLLAPSMQRRLNIEVSSLDVKWKKDRVDWEKLAASFLAEVDDALSEITSVPVDEDGIESSLVGLISPEGTRIV